MQEMKLKHVFGYVSGKEEVYRIEDNLGQTLYVGKAGKQEVAQRLLNHFMNYFDNSRKRKSKITMHLFRQNPACFEWNVYIYGLSEVKALCNLSSTPCLACAEKYVYGQFNPTLNARVPNGCKNNCQ